MKTLKNWKQFNEENIYGAGWTTTTSNVSKKPEQVNQPVETQSQPKIKKTDDFYITYFRVPVAIEKNVDESIFYKNEDPKEIAKILDKEGIDGWWFVEDYERWKKYAQPQELGEKPKREDFDDEDDYLEELEDWYDEYNNWQPSIDAYVKDNFYDWEQFINQFKIYGSVVENTTQLERIQIFDVLKDDFNDSDIVQYFDEAKSLGIVSMEVIGVDFDDESRFTIEVKSTKPLTDDDKNKVKEYIEGQCSDGWGESLEQQEIEGYYVHTWWDHKTINAPDYEILVD
ncbi:MAG: hypothetical protein HPY57_15325 [Ignavibacteria bacterium]|nr:hypothetical protein [Ignavibacteria bacterium]